MGQMRMSDELCFLRMMLMPSKMDEKAKMLDVEHKT
jgi:hypothetical protein